MNKKYLDETTYQKNKKNITRVALIILVLGIILGISLITIGVFKSRDTKDANSDRLSAIKVEKEELNKKIDAKEYECDSMDMDSPSWFQDKNKCNREVLALKSDLAALTAEEFKLKNDSTSSIKNTEFYIFGAIAIIFSLIISGSIYAFAKRRELMAFGMQQMMPLVEEGVEKITPIAGGAMDTLAPHVGNMAKEVARGIKEGINDEKK